MPNVLEAAVDVMKSLIDDDKQPIHIGEAMLCWTYIAAIGEFNNYVKIGLNTTEDEELKEALHDAIKLCGSQRDRLQKFMVKEGIQLPEMAQLKPDADSNSIPSGVKLTDDEIANALSIKVASAILECATGIAQAIRTDVGLMWAEFQQEQMIYGAPLKQLLKKRGWLKQPPFYLPPGTPQHQH